MPELVCKVQLAEPLGDAVARATMLDYRLRHQDGTTPLLFATMPQARVAIAGRLSRTHRLQARLAPRPASVRAARHLVDEACRTWQLSHLRDDAALIMSELASNAVDHAGGDFVVTVFRCGSRLHLAVRDGNATVSTDRDARDHAGLTAAAASAS